MKKAQYEEETIRDETAHLDPPAVKPPSKRTNIDFRQLLKDMWDIGTAIPKGLGGGILNRPPRLMRGDGRNFRTRKRRNLRNRIIGTNHKNWLTTAFRI